MIPNNNLSVLPWYSSIEQQNARKWWAYGRVYPLFTPAGFLLPFQIQLPITEVRQIISWKIYDKTGNEVANLMSMQNLIIQKIINNQYSVLIYNGLMPIVAQMQNGQYYSYLEVDTDSQGFFELYSEIFTVVHDMEPYLKITWWDNADFVMDAGTIVYKYADGMQFRNVLYLCADIAKPEYPFEEEGETRDGYFFPIKQISEKRYHFSFLASEYLLDVMRFIRMADYANIEYHGQTYSLDTFLITPEWEDNGDIASVKAEFDTATVAKKISWGYVAAATVAVTGVSLDKTSLSLIVGNAEQITATVKPDNATDKSVFWVSMNERIATVDQSGNVTAVGAGTTTITVRTVDGGKTASCSVNVTAAISIIDFILTDGACLVPLLNVKPKQDMVIVSSFYVAQDPGKGNIFYATEDGTIMMYIHQRAGRRIESWGYANDGARDISYGSRPSEPTHYLLKQDFAGNRKHTAYYSNSGSPYRSSELDNYQVSNPSNRLTDGYTDSEAFPSDQCLSVFGRHDDAAGALVAGSRFYGMKIWSGGNLVHDLVPAKKAAEYGIYDAVTQDFYANAGTGTLTGGNI